MDPSRHHPANTDEEREKKEEQFEFMMRLYCLRNWLVVCHNAFMRGEGRIGRGVPYSDIQYRDEEEEEEEETMGSKIAEVVEAAREKVEKLASRVKTAFSSLKGSKKAQVKPQQQPAATKRLLFGEIDTDSASSTGSAGRTLSLSTSSFNVVMEKDCWIKGLLWFYGVGSTFSSSSFSSSAHHHQMGRSFDTKKKDGGVGEAVGLLSVSDVIHETATKRIMLTVSFRTTISSHNQHLGR